LPNSETRNATADAITSAGGDKKAEIAAPVRDEGRGLPTDFEFRSSPGLGMRILDALRQQLNATIEVRRLDPGTEFVVTAPREPKL
jgi:two-component sensor histidine kinase